MEELGRLYQLIPPRGLLGTPRCKEWERTTNRFERYARRNRIDPVEAYKLCLK
jgi:hypothetical protein